MFIILNALLKFLQSLHFRSFGGNLSGLTFNVATMNLRKSEIPLSKVNQLLFELLAKKRPI